MNQKIKNAERTKSEVAVSLTLQSERKVIVGNGIINKILESDNLDFSLFRAFCSAGGYALSFDGTIVAHAAGDEYGEGQQYLTKGFHIEADEDVYPEVVQTSKYFALKAMISDKVTKTVLLGDDEGDDDAQGLPMIDENSEVVDTTTGEITKDA